MSRAAVAKVIIIGGEPTAQVSDDLGGQPAADELLAAVIKTRLERTESEATA